MIRDGIIRDPAVDGMAMRRAVELAYQGEGLVEPNPMVGCTVVVDGQIIAEGYHHRFGGPHAEVDALSRLSAEMVHESTVYVTLEPCTHFGKTPPCVDRLVELKPKRVVIGHQDPYHEVAGRGIAILRQHGIEVDLGVESEACYRLIRPYRKRITQGLPWVIAKWAMTADGRMASASGDSKWISSEASRRHAHLRRGRVDAIGVGIETALRDDPLLTARPPGARKALRIVFDSQARLPLDSQLVKTSRDFPTLLCVRGSIDSKAKAKYVEQGCEVWLSDAPSADDRALALLRELATRGHTNLLVEGGPRLLGTFFDRRWVDEVHIYIAPRIVGGDPKYVPNIGLGSTTIEAGLGLTEVTYQPLETDLFLRGVCCETAGSES